MKARAKLLTYLLYFCMAFWATQEVAGDEDNLWMENASSKGPLSAIKAKYQSLDSKGKFIAGACVGFVGTRLVIQSAVGALKIAGAAFIVAEVLHHTGAVDEIKKMSREQQDFLHQVKGKALEQAENFRVQVRRRLNPTFVQDMFEKDRMGALGLASGALAGTLL